MPEHDAPQSRNEAILQNILGEHNELLEPQSRNEAILQAILYGDSYTEDAQSRIETLLLCILNGTTTDLEPLSRNEEILIAKINGGTYDKEPQSRIEELLIEWLNAFVEKTVTGTVCSFDDAIPGQPFIDLSAEIVPQQASGTPTPTNPLQISGFTSGTITRCGKNLFVSSFSKYTRPHDYYICPIPLENGKRYYVSISQITAVTGCAIQLVKSGTRYSEFVTAYSLLNTSGTITNNNFSFLVDSTYTDPAIALYLPNGETSFDSIFAGLNIQLEQGSSATTYEPYNGQTATVQFGQEVFGGSWLASDGKVENNRSNNVRISDLTWSVAQIGSTGIYRITTSDLANLIEKPSSNSNIADILCSVFPPVSANATYSKNRGISVNTNGVVHIYDDNYNTSSSASTFVNDLGNQEINYELDTPTEITVEPVNFTAREGTNNIFSNTGNTTVKYKARR